MTSGLYSGIVLVMAQAPIPVSKAQALREQTVDQLIVRADNIRWSLRSSRSLVSVLTISRLEADLSEIERILAERGVR